MPPPAESRGEPVSFFWQQTHSMADACFVFSLGRSKDRPTDARVFHCAFCGEDGEPVERCDAPLPAAEWRAFWKFALPYVQTLPTYAPPAPHLLDAADSKIEIVWEADGTCRVRCFDGEHAAALAAYLRTLAGRIAPHDTEETI